MISARLTESDLLSISAACNNAFFNCWRCSSSISLLSLVVCLSVTPGTELADGLAFHRQFHMLIAFMSVPEGVSEESHADFSRDSQFEQSGIEGVAQIVEPDVADSRPADSCFPAGFETQDCLAF